MTRLIETFTITLPDCQLLGRLYQTSRRTGRRITVHETTGELLYDTDDCCSTQNQDDMRTELIQIAAMAVRAVKNLNL